LGWPFSDIHLVECPIILGDSLMPRRPVFHNLGPPILFTAAMPERNQLWLHDLFDVELRVHLRFARDPHKGGLELGVCRIVYDSMGFRSL
jgi:hypothetical protein